MTPLDAHLLVRLALLAAGETITMRQLRGRLEPYLRHRSGLLDATLSALIEAGDVVRVGRSRLRLDDTARVDAIAAAGLTITAGVDWQRLSRVELPALALRLPMPSGPALARFRAADGLRAAILNHHHALRLATFPTLVQVRDALLWRSLADAQHAPHWLQGCDAQIGRGFSVGAVAGLLLSNRLGPSSRLDWQAAIRQLAAAAVGAPRTDADALRIACVQRSLAPIATDGDDQPACRASPTAEPPAELTEFAQAVQRLAARIHTGRFGTQLLFIAPLRDAWCAAYGGANRADFAAQLIAAHRLGMLRLARADLVPAMDRSLVSDSEITYQGAEFHFLHVEDATDEHQ